MAFSGVRLVLVLDSVFLSFKSYPTECLDLKVTNFPALFFIMREAPSRLDLNHCNYVHNDIHEVCRCLWRRNDRIVLT